MAKKGSSSSKTFKNPLVQALGIVLHQMRNSIGLNSDEVAAKIGLGGSSYRMIEAGSAILHPGRSLNIIQVYDKIEFEPLCRLLVAVQVMETGTESVDDFKNATILLGDTDPQLQVIFDALMPVWKMVGKEDANKISQYIDKTEIPNLIADFLTTNKHFGVERERRLDVQLNSLIEDTPSIYLDFILDTLRSLKKHRLHYFPEESRSWENDNKHNFTNLYAVIKDAGSLLDKHNFESFDYNYLWQPQFETLQYIFLDEKYDSETAKKLFRDNLHSALKDKHVRYQVELKAFDEAMEKVSFKSGKAKKKELLNLVKQKTDDEPLDLLWIFTLKNGNKVGFISSSEPQKIFYGTTLNYRETNEKLDSFKQIWGEL